MSLDVLEKNYEAPKVSEKKVRFVTTNFYNILDNLYLSDQIPSFDEKLIASKNIQYLFNFTKHTPFLLNTTNNYHITFMNKINTYSEDKLMHKIDNILHYMFNILSEKKGILLYCENGFDKSLIVVMCFLIKYYNPTYVLELENVLTYVSSRMENYKLNKINNLYIVKLYRNHLSNLLLNNSGSSGSSRSSISSDSSDSESRKGKIVSIIKSHFRNK
jgi:hypothetical protein